MPKPPAPPRRRRVSAAIVIAAVIAGVLAGGLGTASTLRRPARYSSHSILQIDQSLIVTSASEGPIAKLNQLRTKYALLVKTSRVTAGVARRTGFPERAIAAAVSVSIPGPSLLLIVEARTNNPSRARVIADAVAEELIALVRSEMEAGKVPPEIRISMAVVAPAQPGVKFEPTRNRAITVGTLAGLLSLIGVIAIAESARTLRRRR